MATYDTSSSFACQICLRALACDGYFEDVIIINIGISWRGRKWALVFQARLKTSPLKSMLLYFLTRLCSKWLLCSKMCPSISTKYASMYAHQVLANWCCPVQKKCCDLLSNGHGASAYLIISSIAVHGHCLLFPAFHCITFAPIYVYSPVADALGNR